VFLWPLIIFDIAKSDLVIGSIFATIGAVAFILLPFAGKLVDRFGYYRITFLELLILGVTGIGLVFSDTLSLFWFFAALYTIGEVLNVTQAVLLTENVDSEIRGEIMGLDATMDQLLAVLAPFIAGFLILYIGFYATFLAFMLLFWASAVIAGTIYMRKIRVKS
jgi:MFS family permease